MPTLRSRVGRVAASVALLVASSSWLSAQCAIDPNVGAPLALTDDSLSPQQLLGFNFNFGGVNYNAVYVCSNGFVYLFDTAGTVAPPTAAPYVPSVATLLAALSPMVGPYWTDLNPGAGGSVHFNALTGKALITWMAVPEFGQPNTANTLQLTLHVTGAIDVVYGACANITHTALTGWSPGNGATDPGGSNLSSLPLVSTSPTVYELFNAGTFDLSSTAMNAIPAGPNWVLSRPTGCAGTSAYGRGCPRPCDFYELFGANTFDLSTGSILFTSLGNGAYFATTCVSNCFDSNFTTNLNLADDSIAANQNLGFTFPYCGGSTTSISVCSNGYIWLVSGSSATADWTPTVPEFLSQPARLAPFWMDLNPGAGGGVYFDAPAGKAMVTWNQVPAFGVAGSSNTIQLQLFPNGDFLVAWPQAVNNSTTGGIAITGFTQGNGVGDPGATDLSAALPFTTGSGVPLVLGAQAGSRPVIGTTFTMELTQVRSGTIGGLLSLGTSNPNLDLTPHGLPGCSLLSSLSIILSIATSSPTTAVPLAIPNDNSLIGGQLHTQGILIDLSIGAVPAYLSNGLLVQIGL